MTRLTISLILGLIVGTVFTSSVKADQVIFSQYDGVNTWNNVYVEVDNALDFVKPGVGFAPADAGSEGGFSAAVEGSTGSITRRYNSYIYGTSIVAAYMIDTYSKASTSSTFYDRRSYQVFAAGSTTPGFVRSEVVTDPNQSQDNTRAVWEVVVEDVQAQEEVQKSWEQSLPARAIVAVETDVDMDKFITDFMSK